MNGETSVVWFRRDLRLADNPALEAAVRAGGPIVPVFVLDEGEGVRPLGGASRWWLDKSLRALAGSLAGRGGMAQGRVVGQPQVAAEPQDDGGGHVPSVADHR